MSQRDPNDPSSAHEIAILLMRTTTPDAMRYGIKVMLQETLVPARSALPYPGELMYCSMTETVYILFCRRTYQGSRIFIARANGTFIKGDDGRVLGNWFYKDEYRYEEQPEFSRIGQT